MPTQFSWPTFWLKLQLTLTSRKWWALVAALAATWTAYANHVITADVAIQSTIAALAAYSISLGIEGVNKQPPPSPTVTPFLPADHEPITQNKPMDNWPPSKSTERPIGKRKA